MYLHNSINRSFHCHTSLICKTKISHTFDKLEIRNCRNYSIEIENNWNKASKI